MYSQHAKVPALVAGILFCSTFFQFAAQAADVSIRPERVLSVVNADLNGDGLFDRAILLLPTRDSDQLDLLIYLSQSSLKPDDLRLAVSKANISWRGKLQGTQPSLEVNKRGSLVISSGIEGVRDRWTEKLTVVYLDKLFVVAGYTHTPYDTRGLDSASSCDVNFLTGRGVRNNKPFKTTTKAVALTGWSDAAIPSECR